MEKGYLSPPVVQSGSGSTHLLLKSLAGLFVLVALVTLGAFYIQLLKTVYELQAKLDLTQRMVDDHEGQFEDVDVRLHVHDRQIIVLGNQTDTVNKRIINAFTPDSEVRPKAMIVCEKEMSSFT